MNSLYSDNSGIWDRWNLGFDQLCEDQQIYWEYEERIL